jgi:hypothetical protein
MNDHTANNSSDHIEGRASVCVWRDGDLLVVRAGATLPRHCPKCNAEVIEPPLELKNIRRQGRGLVGAAVADVIDEYKGSQYRGPVRMRVYFCGRHHRRRRLLLTISATCLLLGIAGIAICFVMDPKNGLSGAFFFPGAVALGGLAGLAETVKGENPWFEPKKFAGEYVWLKGACSTFLASLPPFEA